MRVSSNAKSQKNSATTRRSDLRSRTNVSLDTANINLLDYVSGGLHLGRVCIIIARPETLIPLNKQLRRAGSNIDELISEGAYLVYDADELRDNILIDGVLDEGKAETVLGGPVQHCTKRGISLRIYSELQAVMGDGERTSYAARSGHFWSNLLEPYGYTIYYSVINLKTSEPYITGDSMCEFIQAEFGGRQDVPDMRLSIQRQ